MKNIITTYGGVVIGSIYGLAMRLFFGVSWGNYNFEFAGLFSVTFIWIVPVIIGITPLIFATNEQLGSRRYTIGRPILTVVLFFLFAFSSGKEDMICILIISLPFLVCAGIGGLIFAKMIREIRNRNRVLYSLFFLPLLSGLVEEKFPTPSQNYNVSTVVIIKASPGEIWENVVRVKQISDNEYNSGFFNYTGIPRPLYAELNSDTIGATRIGHFEGGLTFNETVTTWNKNKKVAFSIRVVPSSIRQTVFDQHILKGNHFTFLNAAYELEPIDRDHTRLTLSSNYRLDTKINTYSSLWGEALLSDFQERLLDVIKKRCEK